jgi:hypothetical protein
MTADKELNATSMSQTPASTKMAEPTERPLKIYALDPMSGRTTGNRISILVPNETLAPGPAGERVEVVDYDGARDCYYQPVDLNDPAILMQGGIEPTEADPRFHQQMVYAVTMKTLENYDHALGRTLPLHTRKHQKLRLMPHAFRGPNAFYDRDLHAVLFGYFRADRDDPGPNLPGQNVFTCLSHDIIVHEVTHALVNRFRRYFMEPSNPDVLGFHEGFSDIVALFQHFSFPELVRNQIQEKRGDLRKPGCLVEMARQFGYASGMGRSLRAALDVTPDKQSYQKELEAHKRGAILVAAVFDAFFAVYQRRIADLFRIAQSGSGIMPRGDLHPDLVNRLAREVTKTAQNFLNMCIRALDYLPPVDVTYGDYLRALVTADYEVCPADEMGQRSALIDGFRVRGIYPQNVVSLAEESLWWETPDRSFPKLPLGDMATLVTAATLFSRSASQWLVGGDGPAPAKPTKGRVNPEGTVLDMSRSMAHNLHGYARRHARELLLDPQLKIEVHGFHPVFRVAPDGHLVIEIVAQFAQKGKEHLDSFQSLPARGGTTIVASCDGTVRYLIAKPLPSKHLPSLARAAARERLEQQRAHVANADVRDAALSYLEPRDLKKRAQLRLRLAEIN